VAYYTRDQQGNYSEVTAEQFNSGSWVPGTPIYSQKPLPRDWEFSPDNITDEFYRDDTERAYFEMQPIGNTKQAVSTSQFYVDPYAGPQDRMADLTRSRSDFIQQKSKPLEEKLFGYSTYDNPNLEQQYFDQAVPTINNAYNAERQSMGRTMDSSGMDFSGVEQKLYDRLSSLNKQESIASAATNIKNRLRDRELMIGFGGSQASAAGVQANG
jgi:hypothetical protein